MRALAVFVLSLGLAGGASGDSFQTSVLAAGVQTPLGITPNYETFDSRTSASNGLPFTTSYNNSGFTGTYSGSVSWNAASVYGGASGKGVYAETFSTYSISFNSSINYFGLWLSGLDAGNQLSFYRDNSLLYTFTPTDFIKLVGNCPGSAYCGNPNPNFQGGNSGQQYAYVNLYDSTGTFNKIVFNETGGGFESDNHAVGLLTRAPVPVATPEPPLLVAVGLTLLTAGLIHRRKRACEG